MRLFFYFSTHNLPAQQQYTQNLINQFNEDERQWRDKYYHRIRRALILLLSAQLGKMKKA